MQNGNARISIDVFAEDKESVKVHIQQQLLNFAQGMKESSFWNECKLSIFVNQNLYDVVFNCMEHIGLQKYFFVTGAHKRDVNNMYVYQKSI